MTISAMKNQIGKFHEELREGDSFFNPSPSIKIRKQLVANYLENLRHLVSFTPILLTEAISRAHDRGDASLQQYFKMKLDEEVGHDKWGEDDINKIEIAYMVNRGNILPTMEALLLYCKEIINKDPALYLPYIFFAEYFTVIAGPPVIKSIEEKTGIPSHMMSIIGNHADLDQEHTSENVHFLNSFLKSRPEYKDQFLSELNQIFLLFSSFASELTYLN